MFLSSCMTRDFARDKEKHKTEKKKTLISVNHNLITNFCEGDYL